MATDDQPVGWSRWRNPGESGMWWRNLVEFRCLFGEDAGVMLLVPSDPVRPHRPDEHFAAEARAARDLGVGVAVVDHDALAGADDIGPRYRQ